MSESREIMEIPRGRVQSWLFSIYAESGTWGVVRVITVISVGASVVLTVVGAGLTSGLDRLPGLLPLAVVVPLVVAPAASYLVADLMSSLVEAYERVRVVSLNDPLTSVLNRRGFFEACESQFATWPDQHPPIAAMVDLDNFKAANDRHGHEFGDQILGALGRRLQELVGSTGVVGRVGGDEFALVVDSQQLDASELEHRLSQACRQISGPDTMVVGASFGVVPARRGDSIDAILSRADRALYVHKRSEVVDAASLIEN